MSILIKDAAAYAQQISDAEEVPLFKYLSEDELRLLEGSLINKHKAVHRGIVASTGLPYHLVQSDELTEINGYIASIHKELVKHIIAKQAVKK